MRAGAKTTAVKTTAAKTTVVKTLAVKTTVAKLLEVLKLQVPNFGCPTETRNSYLASYKRPENQSPTQ